MGTTTLTRAMPAGSVRWPPGDVAIEEGRGLVAGGARLSLDGEPRGDAIDLAALTAAPASWALAVDGAPARASQAEAVLAEGWAVRRVRGVEGRLVAEPLPPHAEVDLARVDRVARILHLRGRLPPG